MNTAGSPRLTASRLALSVGATVLLSITVGALAMVYGSSDFGGMEVLGAWMRGDLSETQSAILWTARFPRVALAGLVGAALATSGAVFQAILRNPLADPYILGVSGGAALGGTLLLAIGTGLSGIAGLPSGLVAWIASLSPPVAAFAGAIGALGVIYTVDRWAPGGRSGNYVLLLTGVIVNAFASSVILFLKSVVSARKAQQLLFYLMGTLSVEGGSVWMLVGTGLGIGGSVAGLTWFARDLNVLSLGDEEAAALGVDVDRVRWWTVGISSLAVAIAVAFTGLIGFVGLVVPHGVRLVVGPDHRVLLPCCAFTGAAFLTASDLLTRVAFGLFSTALPVGVVTAFVGAPLFMFFLWRNLTRQGAGAP